MDSFIEKYLTCGSHESRLNVCFRHKKNCFRRKLQFNARNAPKIKQNHKYFKNYQFIYITLVIYLLKIKRAHFFA